MGRIFRACLVGLLCILWLPLHQVLGAQKIMDIAKMTDNDRQKAHNACLEIIARIQNDLQAAGNQFPRLRDVKNAKNVELTGFDSGQSIKGIFNYKKNVRIVKNTPGQPGPSVGEAHFIENDGIELNVYILDWPSTVGVTERYELPVRTAGRLIVFGYHLTMNPKDDELQRVVKKIIDSNVRILNDSLSQLQGNPN
jgi:hypothetical protein